MTRVRTESKPRASKASRPVARSKPAPARTARKSLGKDELSTGLGRKLRLRTLAGQAQALGVSRAGAWRVDGRTTGDALWDMDRVLKGERKSEKTPWGSLLLRNPPDVNDQSDWDYRSSRYQDAKAQVAANGALEAEALKRMTPAEREAYASVRTELEKSGDVVALLSLQRLLFTGQLPGQKDAMGRMTTLDRLAAISSGRAPLANGVNRTALLTTLVQELATPSAISQGPKGTCGPTTVLIELAMKNPSEYVRLAMDLASPRGECTLASGLVVHREPGTEHNDGSGRSVVQRIVASALMEATNLSDYDPVSDVGSGAWATELATLHQAIFGGRLNALDRVADPAKRKAMVDAALADLSKGKPTPMVIDIGDNGTGGSLHWVLVTGRETRGGKEYIRYVNPWGQEEVMPREEFERRLRCNLDKA